MARLIGLTGGIATGKTSVAAMLAARGAVVVDADLLAREVVEPGSEGLAAVAAEFGAGVLTSDGGLDRQALGALVFADADRRRRLEAITHPRIRSLMAERILAALGTDAILVVADIPLLYETGRPQDFDGVLVAFTDAETQLRRLRRRDGLDAAEAARRLAAQLPIEEKRRRSTWWIDNSGDLSATADQVDAWWRANVAGEACT